MRALRAVDFAEMTMVSSFYVGKCKISGSYIQCRFLQSHFRMGEQQMDQSFHNEQINKLNQRLIEINEKKDKIISKAIEEIKTKNISSICLPKEFSKLDEEYWNIEEQLWNARSTNKEIVYLQDVIFSLNDSIELVDKELARYECLEQMGIKVISENAEWNPIKELQKNKRKAQERINECRAKIKEIKS